MRIGDTILCEWAKDGGPESKVDGFWFFRSKRLFTVAVLKFAEGSRGAYHSHAFNAVSWLLSGALHELFPLPDGTLSRRHWPSARPIVTTRDDYHQVIGCVPASWVLTFRGPWVDTWRDNDQILTHNRQVVG